MTESSRRRFLRHTIGAAGGVALRPARGSAEPVPNISGLDTVEVARVVAPATAADITRAIEQWDGKVAVGGGRYSMGGQAALAGALHIDMRAMNRLLSLDGAARIARVEAGMRWRDLQDVLDPIGLAVKTMQSYANFTIGGSVSVNAHGRYVGNGPVGNTVRALRLVLADGRAVDADRDRNGELFRAAIGGYGAVGIITEVELDLAVNEPLERRTEALSLDAYVDHFHANVASDPHVVLHNADLLPPDFDTPACVTWHRTTRRSPPEARLVPRNASYAIARGVLWAITEMPGGTALRHAVEYPRSHGAPVVAARNFEASRDVAELEPWSRRFSTYVLQEYFVPVRRFAAFARVLRAALRRDDVQVLNVSIRHSPRDAVAMVPWAHEDVFSFVIYHKQRTDARTRGAVARWTRELVDLALANDGRFYLPYQLHATRQQFERAYPEVSELRALKQRVDPQARFSNEMWSRYL